MVHTSGIFVEYLFLLLVFPMYFFWMDKLKALRKWSRSEEFWAHSSGDNNKEHLHCNFLPKVITFGSQNKMQVLLPSFSGRYAGLERLFWYHSGGIRSISPSIPPFLYTCSFVHSSAYSRNMYWEPTTCQVLFWARGIQRCTKSPALSELTFW